MTANLAHDEMLITSHLSTTPTPNAAASNQSININELVESLNAWSQSNLKSLSVSRDPSLFSSILISNIGKLAASLTRLNVSFTSFNNHSLDLVCQHLPRIEHLDISGTKVNDLAPLTRLRESLKSLHMYHMRASLTDDIVPVVCALFRLTCIDLSCDISTKIFADTSMSLFDVNHFLEELTRARLSELRFLDISGKTGIKKEAIWYVLLFLGRPVETTITCFLRKRNSRIWSHRISIESSCNVDFEYECIMTFFLDKRLQNENIGLKWNHLRPFS